MDFAAQPTIARPSAAGSAAEQPTGPAGRPLWRFALVSAVGALLWAVGQAYGVGHESPLDLVLCRQLAAAGAAGLRLLGFAALTDPAEPRVLLLGGQPTVLVGGPCNGLVLYLLLVGFVLAYPGSGRRRLWFIPLGIAALWGLNVGRVVALALNHQYSPDTLDFNHHYVFSAVAYALLAAFWVWWARSSGAGAEAAGGPAAVSRPALAPGRWLGLGLLAGLGVVSALQDGALAALGRAWTWALRHAPGLAGWLPAAVPGSVTRLPLAVGAAYAGLYLLASVLGLWLALPERAARRLVVRLYAGALLLYLALLGLAALGGWPALYPTARLLLDGLVSPLPPVALLVLLWGVGGFQGKRAGGFLG